MLISISFAFLGPIEHESGTLLRSLNSLEVRQLIWTNCEEAQEISRLYNLSHLCPNTHTKKDQEVEPLTKRMEFHWRHQQKLGNASVGFKAFFLFGFHVIGTVRFFSPDSILNEED